ncbi:uncharacterized protein ColSpa_01634 [Colletotrichum spaethianum]|uniref:Uncharacterized protein n=1 Tax=Colletotrichum spaethianum TaxID=700344 RepID=A0AA37NYS4_9PEZI|nr:uncharacterized protein ColSpa_01634 [Colletotrichum spaethianum]GKT41453.1 hypothetical protein ColSpa_01634 [Colletotrichum spaethianum]
MASAESAAPEAPKTKPQNKVRKRAPKACLSCRARKRDGVDNAPTSYPPCNADDGEQLHIVNPIAPSSDDPRPILSNESDSQPQACDHSHGDAIPTPTATVLDNVNGGSRSNFFRSFTVEQPDVYDVMGH